MKRHVAVILGALGLTTAGWASQVVYTGPLANESALTHNTTYTLNTANNNIDSLSATVSYGSATVANQTFTDGAQSTGSFTITSNSNLAGKQGTDSLTVLSTNSLTGASINIAGKTLTESIQWYGTQTSTNAVATSIKNAVNNNLTNISATTTGNLVNLKCASSGTWCNNATLSVVGTSSITAGAATFSGGIDNTFLAVNGVSVIRGTGSGQWAVGASTAATANNIATVINANSGLSPIVTSTAPAVCGLTNPCGVVNVTSLGVGTATAYTLYSSSNAQITVSGPSTVDATGRGSSALTGGANASWTISSKNITIAANPFYSKNPAQSPMTALPVLYSSGTIAIGGLTNQTTYYVIPVDANTLQLAITSTGAVAGLGITLTSSSTQTTAHTYTLAPLAISGTPSFKWQASDDGVSWNDVAISSVTVTSYTFGGASNAWDFGDWNWNYVRLNAIGPTTGGLNLLATLNGKHKGSH